MADRSLLSPLPNGTPGAASGAGMAAPSCAETRMLVVHCPEAEENGSFVHDVQPTDTFERVLASSSNFDLPRSRFTSRRAAERASA
eukprot:5577392-Prymnesium_polylepis.1